MFKRIERGRAALVTILWLQLMLGLGVILLSVAFLQFEAAGKRLLTLLCEIGLMVALYRGSRWAQWLYVFGFAAGAILVVLLWIGAGPGVPPLLGAALVAYFVVAAWAIGFAPSLAAFLKYQRGELQSQVEKNDAPAEDGLDEIAELRLCPQCRGNVPARFTWCPLCGTTCAVDRA